MPRDYLKVEYDTNRRPVTTYPEKLAAYIADLGGMQRGNKLLEIGSGRAEVAKGFVDLGLDVTLVDRLPSAAVYAQHAGARFLHATIDVDETLPVAVASQDFVFTKSVIEHIREPVAFLETCRKLLKPGGTIFCLTPDWEANFRIFFDDVTHVTPFTRETMRQALELSGYEEVQAFRFRQLPITWRNPFMSMVSAALAPLAPVRTKQKFLRWSRELMLCGIGVKPKSDFEGTNELDSWN